MKFSFDGEKGGSHEFNGPLQVLFRLLRLFSVILELGCMLEQFIMLSFQFFHHFLQNKSLIII